MATELWNLAPLSLAAKPRRFAHGVHIGFGGIPTVAACTRQTFLGMNVGGELLFGDLERRIERAVAIEASVLHLGENLACRCRHHEQNEQRPQKPVISPCIHRSSAR